MKIRKTQIFFILLGVLILPVKAFADSACGTGVTICSIMDAAVNTVLYIASGVTVILWVVTGILFLTAQGDPGKLTSAKTALIAAVAGTILVIVATAALNIVGVAINVPI